jgi:hypothetical protein
VRTGQQQVPPLHSPFGYAPVGMTILLRTDSFLPPPAAEGPNLLPSTNAEGPNLSVRNKIVIPTGAYPKGECSGGTCCWTVVTQIL